MNADQVSTTGVVDTKQQSGLTKRRQYSEALKRQMVASSCSAMARSACCILRPQIFASTTWVFYELGVDRADVLSLKPACSLIRRRAGTRGGIRRRIAWTAGPATARSSGTGAADRPCSRSRQRLCRRWSQRLGRFRTRPPARPRKSGSHRTRWVLKPYIGRMTGPRVLSGQARGGAGEEITGILWPSDLRSFTQLSDGLQASASSPSSTPSSMRGDRDGQPQRS
jgi:hypothetical protein